MEQKTYKNLDEHYQGAQNTLQQTLNRYGVHTRPIYRANYNPYKAEILSQPKVLQTKKGKGKGSSTPWLLPLALVLYS